MTTKNLLSTVASICLATTMNVSAQRHFYPTEESLIQYNPPEWYQDAKIGYWVHWGIYSVPAYRENNDTAWYGRWMYAVDEEGKPKGKVAEYHWEKYGSPDKFGYIDFIPMWRAEKFDADTWADLFVAGGAKFFTMMGMHHDGYPLWDSKTQPLNSVTSGPHKDLVGEMERAIRERGLKFGLSNHSAWTSVFFEHNWKNGFDAEDSSLYGNAVADAEEVAQWRAENEEMIERYKPDLMWYDWCWNREPYGLQNRLNFVSWYYNKANDWGISSEESPEVVVAYKNVGLGYVKEKMMPDGCAILDIERGGMGQMYPFVWMADTSLSFLSWGYLPGDRYRTRNQVVDMLIDIVSKNGVLQLNIGPKADGTIPEEIEQTILGVGEWLSKNGEGIYATRPWAIYGEGPTSMSEKARSDAVDYTAEDIRFTRCKESKSLYIHILKYNESILIKSLGSENIDLSSVESMVLLDGGDRVRFKQSREGTTIKLPKGIDTDREAYTIKVTFKDLIPEYKL